MSLDLTTAPAAPRHHRADPSPATPTPHNRHWPLALAYLAAALFVAWGFSDRDLTDPEARLAVAAQHGFTPLAAVFGGWSPGIPFGSIAASRLTLLLLGPDAQAWPGLVHLPQLIALLALAALAANAITQHFGRILGFAAPVALCLSVGWIDRFGGLRLDALTALALMLLLDQILQRGSTWLAGLALALSFAFGGLPAMLLGLGIVVVLGRRGGYVSHRLLLPPLATLSAWSLWALTQAPPAAWAVALLGPLREPPAWLTAPAALGLALPWTPFLLLTLSRPLRASWTPPQRDLLAGWSQAAAVAALAGSLIPGFGPPALAVSLCLIIAIAVITLGTAFTATRGLHVERIAMVLITLLCLAWTGLTVPALTGLAVVVPYYRELAIAIAVLAAAGMAYAIVGSWTNRRAFALGGLIALLIGLKAAHAGLYVPEWNYRLGAGPWGRAIGQWVPPLSPIHVFHAERADLMFATGRQVTELVAPAWLEFLDSKPPHYVLLLPSEFENWPDEAPSIEKLRDFEDDRGNPRVLARTLEPLPGSARHADD